MRCGRFRPAVLAADYQRAVVDKGLCELEGGNHRSLFTVVNFSSLGFRTASHSWLGAGPVADLMSSWETDYYLGLHVDPTVIKIACQHALDPAETLPIAEALGYDHPALSPGKETIMSTDFMVKNATSAIPTWRAVAVKREADLDERTWEKLEIEEEYWRAHGLRWTLVLDTRISKVKARNVDRVWDRYDRANLPCDDETTNAAIAWLTPLVRDARQPFARMCADCDHAMKLRPGTSIAVAHHAIIRGLWPLNFKQPIVPNRPLPLAISRT